ncbi:hypothetical protein Dsin_020123 [Dipteronia sinensis]|uniref:MULE transposase domain-containing protein n=1 Tax=Dipteronia sinensis TaxID=43782 RepID=A0AAE0A922_9ROSI|nr:hypothetical protein Dsin_020123 [Dipteronia sinensis]
MENESNSSDEVNCEKDEHYSSFQNQLELVDYTDILTTDQVFKSRESLIEWAQDIGRNNRLVIVIKKSDVNVDRRKPRISFACERSGVYKKKINKGQKPKRLKATVGVTSTELTFSVAFVFLENERVDNYTWVLEKLKTVMDENMLPSVILTDREIALMNAIQNVFPNASNLLCRWHISRNVLAHCKKLFETNEKWETFICSWNVMVLSSRKQEYIHNLSLMEREFSNYPIALDYVKQAWAESSHSQLKRQLGSSQGNFLSSWTKIHGLLQLQHNEIKASFDRSLTLVQHSFKPSNFKELRGFVSRNALNMILDDYERVDSNDSICSCVVQLTHGLPCAHEISGYKREGLRPYIRDVKDVLGDGNCGFRVVASWMDMGDDNWIQVRRDLIDELQQRYDYYAQLFGYHDRAQEVFMCPGSPMPPIASNCLKYCYPCAEGWATSYTTNISVFRNLVSDGAKHRTITLDSQ